MMYKQGCIGEDGTTYKNGVVVFKNSHRRETVIRKLHDGAWVEPCRQLHKSIEQFVNGDGKVSERGTRPMTPQERGKHLASKGKAQAAEKKRWLELRLAAENDNLDAIDDEDRVKYSHAIEFFRNEGLKKRKTQEYAAGSLSPVLK